MMVSEVGFGGLAIGGGRWSGVTDEDSLAALQRAFELGVTFFDTADLYGYGHSEELIGQAFSGKRSHVVIATKFGKDFRFGEPVRDNYSAAYIRIAVEDSLRRLNSDYIDLYQVHNPPQKLAKDDKVWDTLAALKAEGKIRAFGVSTKNAYDARAYLRAEESAGEPGRFGDTLQVAYNMLDQEAAVKDVFVDAHRQDWGMIGRVPLASGVLSGKYGVDHVFEPGDFRGDWSPETKAEKVRRVDALRFLENDARTLGQAAIAFCLSEPAMSTVISGAKSAVQVEGNVAAGEHAPLSADEMRRVRELYTAG